MMMVDGYGQKIQENIYFLMFYLRSWNIPANKLFVLMLLFKEWDNLK